MSAEKSDILANLMSEQLSRGGQEGTDLYPFIEQLIKQRSSQKNDKRRQELQRLRQMHDEVKGLREWLRYFASMFGACPHCLGQSEACPLCSGAGQAGYFPPDEEVLGMWLEPAMKRLNLKLVVGESSSSLTAQQ